MNVFEAVKQSVTTRQAAEHYGMKVNRNGMCVCPFHNDKDPSMKVDRRFYCFGCGATGDVIDFVSRLYGIGSKEAVLMLAQDFSIPYEDGRNAGKQPLRPRLRRETEEQKFKRMERHCFRVLSDYYHRLRRWKEEYAPRQPDEAWNPRFAEAYNLLTDRTDILKPIGYQRTPDSPMTDTDMKYIRLYLEETYGQTSEKRIQDVADLPCLAFSCARATSQADMLVYPFGDCRDNDSYGGQLPMANKKMIVDEKRYSDIPVWRRYTLTIEEAAGYYHIGEGKLRMLIDTHPNEDFYMMNGNRALIKREKFERYLDRATAV